MCQLTSARYKPNLRVSGAMRPNHSCYVLLLSIVTLSLVCLSAQAGPWVYSDGSPIPAGIIRITTLGSGTPDVRREQVASGFLVEVGNKDQDKFIFDLGSGSFTNLWATGVDFAKLTKVFLSHLHTDHVADLATFYMTASFGRTVPWQVYGPSSDTPELGTAAAIQGLRQFLAWDHHARGKIDLEGRKDKGNQVVVHEFDFKVKNQVVYKHNGITITSTPVDHYQTGGPVAYRFEWNGLSFTYSGDTRPVSTLNELARGTDLFILQVVGPIRNLNDLTRHEQFLLNTSHITPQEAGSILADVKPKVAVAHHAKVNDASRAALVSEIRESGYPKGDIIINEDLNVYEITQDGIEVKKRLVPARNWGYFTLDRGAEKGDPEHQGWRHALW